MDRLRSAHLEICEEHSTLQDALERGCSPGPELSALLHRNRFRRVVRRCPLGQDAASALRVAQVPGIGAATAGFAGLSAIARLASSARGFQHVLGPEVLDIATSSQRLKIYVIGGALDNRALDVVECFDPHGGEWSTFAPMPTPRSDLAAAAVSGRLYAIGGYDGRTLSAVELFDPRINVWKPLAPMPTPRSDFAAASQVGRVYRLGGLDEDYEALDTVECFDPEGGGEWEVRAPMQIPRWSFAVAAIAGHLYALGGFADGQALGVVERFDIRIGRWEVLCPMPTPRSAFAAATVGSRVYALGGSCPDLGRALGVVEVYCPDTNCWEARAPMPTPRSRFAAAAVAGRIYTFGGFGDSGTEALDVVERYDPEFDRWDVLPSMPTRRSGAAVLSC